jgi:uncharacterized protein YwgA
MNDASSIVTMLALVKELRGKGSWAGETHVQKAMFFMNKKFGLPDEFEFVLYKHGPYSFDLHEFLSSLFASCLLEHQINPPYGPRIQLTAAGEAFLAGYNSEMGSRKSAISAVAEWFGGKGVAELEKLATALWVDLEQPKAAASQLAQQVNEIKPHIPVEEALAAVEAVRGLAVPA